MIQDSIDNSKQLQHICSDMVTGNLAAAQLALHEWSRQADCPGEARVLLASLLVHQGQLDAALAVLHVPPSAEFSQIPAAVDPELGRMLVAVLTQADLLQSAARQAAQCFHQLGSRQRMADWLQAVDAPGFSDLSTRPDEEIDTLAAQLSGSLELLPSLVAAQKASPQVHDIMLLRDAINRMSPHAQDDHEMLNLCQAAAELALLVNDQDDARRWAYRGLKIHPLCASLALVIVQTQGDPSMGPSASQVITQVADTFLHYPDVQAAAVRCQFAAGQVDEARLRLRDWLIREPHQKLASELARELAA